MADQPNTSFRPSMNWVHTWAGVVLGALLFIIFWMGTMSVFDREIDRWMQPQTRLASPAAPTTSYDSLLDIARAAEPGKQLTKLTIGTANTRAPFATIHATYADKTRRTLVVDTITNRLIPEPASLGGTGFLYPMHINLILPGVWGWWIVMFAAIAMLLLLVTGVIIHHKIFADFFTFRPEKKLRRSSLDLHNLSGTIFLPFHFLITFSGLMVFSGWYTSIPWYVAPASVGEPVAALINEADQYGHFRREAAGRPGGGVALAPLVQRAEAIWRVRHGTATPADYIDIDHIGDAQGYMAVRGNAPRRMVSDVDEIVFDLATGRIVKDSTPTTTRTVQKWLEGFHLVRFDHWLIRWFYFIGGLAGCLMIATGFVFWSVSRRKRDAQTQPLKVRFVEALTVAAVSGVILATCAYFVVNRMIPEGASPGGFPRFVIEVLTFFGAWLATAVHAGVRQASAWKDQAWVIAGLSVAAILLNWLTTGHHPIAAINRDLWAIVGMDSMLLLNAVVAIYAARRLGQSTLTVGDAP
ncbi:MAG: PepSY-associated TM helix domain-containing protein [Sphingobium sp.]